jgi:ABC-type sugar transport system ATPase subunit
MSSHSTRIEITNVVKRYQRAGGKVITPVDGISLSVNREELVVLLGPSGCDPPPWSGPVGMLME